MRVKLITFLLVIIAAALAVFPIEAFKVTGAAASVSEPEYRGFCPHRFIFTGRITANREGMVRYRWLRSDGSAGAEETLVFAAAGTKTVSSYWELGGTMGTYPDHWMQIEIVAPNSRTSNKAVFELQCLPRLRAEMPKRYSVSGTIVAAGGQHLEWLAGLQLTVKLKQGPVPVKSQVVTFGSEGTCRYAFVLLGAPGDYRIELETVHPTDPDKFYLCFVSSDPASIVVNLTEAAPDAPNRNFDLTWSWRHLDRGEEAFASPCW